MLSSQLLDTASHADVTWRLGDNKACSPNRETGFVHDGLQAQYIWIV